MSDAIIDLSSPRHHDQLVVEIDGPDDDPTLEVAVARPVVLDEDGATCGAPELSLRIGTESITLTERDQVLRLQALINRAANSWRAAAVDLP